MLVAPLNAGVTGSRALTPPVAGQGAVFIGVVLLKSGIAVIITYPLSRVNIQVINKSYVEGKNCKICLGMTLKESPWFTVEHRAIRVFLLCFFVSWPIAEDNPADC